MYNESVTITTPYLTIRGKDRNGVIIDGEFMRENGIQIYETDGVSVENLSVRNFSLNAVYWNGSKGYKASHLTVYNNGDMVFMHSTQQMEFLKKYTLRGIQIVGFILGNAIHAML